MVLTDGRVYAGEDALAVQLVDERGALNAVQYAEIENIEDPSNVILIGA